MFRLFRKFSDIAQSPLRERIVNSVSAPELLRAINTPEATTADLVFGLKELSHRIRMHNLSRQLLHDPNYYDIQNRITRDIMKLDKDNVLEYSRFLKTFDKLSDKEFSFKSERWLAKRIDDIVKDDGYTLKELGELADNLMNIKRYLCEIEISAACQDNGTLEDYMKIVKAAQKLNKEPIDEFWNKFTEFFDHIDYENMSPQEIFSKLGALYSQPNIHNRKICQITDKALSSLVQKLNSLEFSQVLKILEYYSLQADLDQNIYLSFISKLEQILLNPPYVIKSEQTFKLISLIAEISKQKEYPIVPSLKNALLNDIRLKLDTKALHIFQYKPLVNDIIKIEKVLPKELSLSLLNFIKTSPFIGIWTFECIRLFESFGIGDYTDNLIVDTKEAIKAISKLNWVEKFSIFDTIMQTEGYDFKPACFDCFKSIKSDLSYVSANNAYGVLEAYLQANLSNKTKIFLTPDIERIIKTLNAVKDPLSDPLILKHLLVLDEFKSELPKVLLEPLADRMPLSDIEKVLAVDSPVFTAKSVLQLFKDLKTKINDKILAYGMKYLANSYDYEDWIDYSLMTNNSGDDIVSPPLFDKYYEKFFNELVKSAFPYQYSRIYSLWGRMIIDTDYNEYKSKRILKMIELIALSQKLSLQAAFKLHWHFIKEKRDYSSTILQINFSLKKDHLTEEQKEKYINQFFSIPDNMSFDKLKTKIITYNAISFGGGEKEEKFRLELEEQIRNLSPRHLSSTLDLISQLFCKVLNTHYDFTTKIINVFGEYVVKNAHKLDANLLTKAFWGFGKHHNKNSDLYKVLLSELGKNYYDLTPVNKAHIFSSFGKKGLRVKDAYEVMSNDFLQNIDDYLIYSSEILTSIGEVNFENEDWNQKLIKIFVEKYDFSQKNFSNYWYYNFVWALVKSKVSEDVIQKIISYAHDSSFQHGKRGIKQYYLYYHFKNLNQDLFEKNFRNSQDKINWQTVYGTKAEWLDPIVDALASVGIKALKFDNLEDITTPLLIKEKKLCLWPKNPYTMTYDNEMLKGEFMFVKDCIAQRGGKVQLLDLEELKGLDNKKIIQHLESQGILS